MKSRSVVGIMISNGIILLNFIFSHKIFINGFSPQSECSPANLDKHDDRAYILELGLIIYMHLFLPG